VRQVVYLPELKYVCRSVQIDCKCVSRKMSQANEDDSITTDSAALCVCVCVCVWYLSLHTLLKIYCLRVCAWDTTLS